MPDAGVSNEDLQRVRLFVCVFCQVRGTNASESGVLFSVGSGVGQGWKDILIFQS